MLIWVLLVSLDMAVRTACRDAVSAEQDAVVASKLTLDLSSVLIRLGRTLKLIEESGDAEQLASETIEGLCRIPSCPCVLSRNISSLVPRHLLEFASSLLDEAICAKDISFIWNCAQLNSPVER